METNRTDLRPFSERAPSVHRKMLSAGFLDADKAAALWADPAFAKIRPADDDLLATLAGCADSDLALLTLVRLAESPAAGRLAKVLAPQQDPASATAVQRLVFVLGASSALGDEVFRHPELFDELTMSDGVGLAMSAAEIRAELLTAVGADPEAAEPVASGNVADTTNALRRAYRKAILRIAADDLTVSDPVLAVEQVSAALADLAAAAVEAALAIARLDEPDYAKVRLAVIGMGKTGARELNYVSDVDVMYVAEPAEGVAEDEALAIATRLATTLQRVCAGPGAEPPLWQVDAALRPEGKQGHLVRTLPSFLSYYKKWAKTWEFQALLKARPIAGDAKLGAEFRAAVEPLIWQAVSRENFVDDSQAMRRRVEANVPAADAERQIKLGRGGLRDVEFTVQLLQLVHGRADESIRVPGTLAALAALAAAGYVARDDAEHFANCYRFLRTLEHRIQLFRLKRTHLLPTAEPELRRLARALGLRTSEALTEAWKVTRRDVRSLHERLFYRPLLPAFAKLSTADVSLSPQAAKARFEAIGYRDPNGAIRHVAALTEGTTRRAALQRQLLPVLLGWFAEGADADRGLLAFRQLSDELGGTHWYLKLLRDSGSAAHRLAQVLSTSRYLSDFLARSPQSVQWFDDDASLRPIDAARLAQEGDAVLSREHDVPTAAIALRALRRRELARTAAGELLGLIDRGEATVAMSEAADFALQGALRIATAAARMEFGLAENPTRLLIVAMGRLGGRELGYGSDADVLYVHDPLPGADPDLASRFALSVATRVRELLGSVGPEPPLSVDSDLRPEGRQGPVVRTLDSYREYYERWAEVWEAQALLRARPVAGDGVVADRFSKLGAGRLDGQDGGAKVAAPGSLAAQFIEIIDPLRYPADGLTPAQVREIRRIKARVEGERLPRGVDPLRHLKLGPGGIADVEWTAQMLQLQHAHEYPSLRVTSTIDALTAAADAGLLAPADAETLINAWVLASRLRSAVVLWTGRVSGSTGDVLPNHMHDLAGVARVLGDVGSGQELQERYLRATRLAREVVERVLYER